MTSLADLLLTVLAIMVLMIFLGSLYSFGFAIYKFIFSNGDNDQIKEAWNSIRYMIFGIVLTLFLLFMLPIALKRMHVAEYDHFSAKNIFAKMSQLTSGALGLGKDAYGEYNKNGTITIQPVPGSSQGTVTQPRQNTNDYDDLEL